MKQKCYEVNVCVSTMLANPTSMCGGRRCEVKSLHLSFTPTHTLGLGLSSLDLLYHVHILRAVVDVISMSLPTVHGGFPVVVAAAFDTLVLYIVCTLCKHSFFLAFSVAEKAHQLRTLGKVELTAMLSDLRTELQQVRRGVGFLGALQQRCERGVCVHVCRTGGNGSTVP